jgi:hypothetical protein
MDNKLQRKLDLIKLARVLYESALHEEDKERLELHRKLAVEAKQLFDDTYEQDHTLHPDLGLELLLFIELKKEGKSEEAETDHLEALKIIEDLEKS